MTLLAAAPYGTSDASVRARLGYWQHRWPDEVTVVGGGRSPLDLAAALWKSAGREGPRLLLRNLSPVAQGWPERHFLRATRGGPAIYELDDGLPFDDGRIPELGAWWKPIVAKTRIARRAASAADRVIAGNEVLAEWAQNHCPDVRIIPTCVDVGRYSQRQTYEIEGVPIIGWIGSPATAPHLRAITEPLVEVHRATGARLVVVSTAHHPLDDRIRPFTTVVPWSLDCEFTITATFDVGIMPLPDRDYERAKCAYKLLHYGAARVPMIGSPVGASATVLASSGSPAPQSATEWVDALIEVFHATALARLDRAERGRAVIASDFDFNVWAKPWRRAVGLDD